MSRRSRLCLRLVAVRPEGTGEPGALDLAAVAEGQEGEQPLDLAGAGCPPGRTRQGSAVRPRFERTKEMNRQRRDRVVGGTHRAFLPYSRSSPPDSPRGRAFPVAPTCSRNPMEGSESHGDEPLLGGSTVTSDT